jgi:FMN phosphatase YigB (HAD superfamily)
MISFVYFDVGGVVVDDFSDNNKWQDLKQELGVNESNSAAFEALWKQYALELCIDRDVETLVPIFVKELGLKLPEGYSLLAGFVDRFYANPGIWPIIENLKSKAKVGLLTNMYPHMFAAIEKRHILPKIQWDQIVDSSLELLQKPDRKLFELAEKRAGVPHDEVLFIDNGSEHVQEAETYGWQAFFYDSSNHHAAVRELDSFLSRQEFRNPELTAFRTSVLS